MAPDLASRFSLTGKRALVTGASGALGAQFSYILASAGASVALAARRTGPMEVVQARIAAEGGRAEILKLDITEVAQISAAFDDAESALGGPIDVIVNNSGIASPGNLIDQLEEDWAALMAVNLDGARRVASEGARRLIATNRPASIINVASILGFRQGSGLAAYATSKAALIQLTKQQALEWARHGIRVNALAPGYIETDLNRDFFTSDHGQAVVKRIPMRRLGRADELDGAVLLLTSDVGSFITGSVLVVDGGHLLGPL